MNHRPAHNENEQWLSLHTPQRQRRLILHENIFFQNHRMRPGGAAGHLVVHQCFVTRVIFCQLR